jgi:pRiA4b ORF-3-like protein
MKRAPVHQLHIGIEGISPAIWRRLQVPSDFTLGELHLVLQAAFGWSNSHMHEFVLGGVHYSRPDEDAGIEVQDERRFRLADVVTAGTHFVYRYDFGDEWVHRIEVEQVLAAESDRRSPECLAGARACPPEDCGGPPGYDELLVALQGPETPRQRELFEWIGGSFEAEQFDLADINDAFVRALDGAAGEPLLDPTTRRSGRKSAVRRLPR